MNQSSTQLALIAQERTDLTPGDIEHLELLLQEWTILSDLAFADLVLWLPTWNEAGFIAAAQLRPATARTHIPDDLVGHFAAKGRHYELDRALGTGQVAYGAPTDGHEVTMAIPVRHEGRTIALLGRYAGPNQPGRLENIYAQLSDILTAMVTHGEFPSPSGNDQGTGGRGGAPRAGDGLVVLDQAGKITFASPNARSAFRRLGFGSEVESSVFADLVTKLSKRGLPVDDTLTLVARGRIQATAELDGSKAAVTVRSIPLLHQHQPHGTLILMRDVTDIRRRERALLGKDATIREIHHRVKNNLQTVASLLRLTGRRLENEEARLAIAEAVRRVGTIAVVHDLLAHEPADTVNFDEVAQRVVALTKETSGFAGATYEINGEFGAMASDLTSPLALVIAELVANAFEHGTSDGGAPWVSVTSNRSPSQLTISISDHGPGIDLPVDTSKGLGLPIVMTLVQDELHGQIEFTNGSQAANEKLGTVVSLTIPLN